MTKGARHKLLLSIKKLNERGAILEGVEAELRAGGSAGAARALERLRGVLLSPMAPASNLPAGVVRALRVASECLGASAPTGAPPAEEERETPVEPLSLHCWLVERALHHEAFARHDLREALRSLRHRLPPRQFFHHVSDMPLNRRCPKPRSASPRFISSRGDSVGTIFTRSVVTDESYICRWRINTHNGYQKQMQKRLWSNGPCKGPLVPRGKSHSYPPHGAPPRAPPAPPAPPAPRAPADDYSSLDALCLQMTEHAID